MTERHCSVVVRVLDCGAESCRFEPSSQHQLKNSVHPAMNGYGKCPKILNTKVSDKTTYANSADQDQTAPKEAV